MVSAKACIGNVIPFCVYDWVHLVLKIRGMGGGVDSTFCFIYYCCISYNKHILFVQLIKEKPTKNT